MTVYVVCDIDYDSDSYSIVTATHSKSLAYEIAEKFGKVLIVRSYDNAEIFLNKIWDVWFSEDGSVGSVYDRSDNLYRYYNKQIGEVNFIKDTFRAFVTVMCDTREEAIDVAKQLYTTAVFEKLERRKNEQN